MKISMIIKISIILIILLLPQYILEVKAYEPKSTGWDLVIAVDESKTMQNLEIERYKETLFFFIEMLYFSDSISNNESYVSIYSYGGLSGEFGNNSNPEEEFFGWFSVTKELNEIKGIIEELSFNEYQKTDIGESLKKCIEMKRENSINDKAIFMITDGLVDRRDGSVSNFNKDVQVCMESIINESIPLFIMGLEKEVIGGIPELLEPLGFSDHNECTDLFIIEEINNLGSLVDLSELDEGSIKILEKIIGHSIIFVKQNYNRERIDRFVQLEISNIEKDNYILLLTEQGQSKNEELRIRESDTVIVNNDLWEFKLKDGGWPKIYRVFYPNDVFLEASAIINRNQGERQIVYTGETNIKSSDDLGAYNVYVLINDVKRTMYRESSGDKFKGMESIQGKSNDAYIVYFQIQSKKDESSRISEPHYFIVSEEQYWAREDEDSKYRLFDQRRIIKSIIWLSILILFSITLINKLRKRKNIEIIESVEISEKKNTIFSRQINSKKRKELPYNKERIYDDPFSLPFSSTTEDNIKKEK